MLPNTHEDQQNPSGNGGVIGGEAGTYTDRQIVMQGTYYWYLLRPDTYVGRFSISGHEDTAQGNAQLQVALSDTVNPMIYQTDNGYRTFGVFAWAGLFDKLLVSVGQSDNHDVFAAGQAFIAAPAASPAEAQNVYDSLSSLFN